MQTVLNYTLSIDQKQI